MTDRAGRMRLATTVLLVAACRAGPADVAPPPTEIASACSTRGDDAARYCPGRTTIVE